MMTTTDRPTGRPTDRRRRQERQQRKQRQTQRCLQRRRTRQRQQQQHNNDRYHATPRNDNNDDENNNKNNTATDTTINKRKNHGRKRQSRGAQDINAPRQKTYVIRATEHHIAKNDCSFRAFNAQVHPSISHVVCVCVRVRTPSRLVSQIVGISFSQAAFK